jgi:ABC-type lipoprotein release transport system permease subunit
MRAVAYRLRGTLRRRRGSTLIVAVIVAAVSGALLTLVAGARRTAAAPGAYTRFVGGDVDGSIQQQAGAPLTGAVASLPHVAKVTGMTFLFAAPQDAHGNAPEGLLVFAGTPPLATRVASGRLGANAHEFVVDRTFFTQHHLHLGDRYQVLTWTHAQGDHGQGFVKAPKGPSFRAVLVGTLDSGGSLEDNYSVALFPTDLLRQDIGTSATLIYVRLDHGFTRANLRRELDSLPNGRALSLDPGTVISAEVRNGVDAQARGTWLMALIAALAAVVTLGQLLTRYARLSEAERAPLAAIGFTRGQLAAEMLACAAIPAATGVVAGIAVAVASSGWFPAGFVRRLEPHPGVRVDPAPLLLGGAIVVTCLLLWVAVAWLTSGRDRLRSAPWPLSESIARRAPDPAAATGARFALTSHDGSSASSLGTLTALGLVIAGVVGATVFAVSLERLVTDRGRFGANYTFQIGDNSDLTANDLRIALADDPDVSGLMILTAGQVRVGGTTVALAGLERVRGGLVPRVTAGRLPTERDEVALGRVTARSLHAHLGDTLHFAGAKSTGLFRVVGYAVVPTVGGNDGVGHGGVVTAEALQQLDAEPSSVLAGVVLRPGAPADTRERIGMRLDAQAGTEDLPGSIINVGRVRSIPALLAALLAALALLTLGHTLIVSVQRRRRDVAVLRAIGADRRWISRAVHWQATLLTALPLLFGIPIGLAVGSVVFRAFADRVGALNDPSIPLLLLFAMALALIAIANLAALVPARRARRLPAAQLLQAE